MNSPGRMRKEVRPPGATEDAAQVIVKRMHACPRIDVWAIV
jgi:hypothetical protein